MNNAPLKLGVVIGMICVPITFLYGLEILLDLCAYDAPCGNFEKPLMLLLLLVSVALGVLVGWIGKLALKRLLKQ